MKAPANSRRGHIEWLSPASLRLHGMLVAGLALCGVASWIEWSRALDGHALAWVYSFEWPLFALMGTWVWWRLLRGDLQGGAERDAPQLRLPMRHDVPPDDPDLLAWQDYLARLHAVDPPGGPPQR